MFGIRSVQTSSLYLLLTGDPVYGQAMSTEAVAIKLPPMWTEDVETWFIQAEAQFHLRKITDETTKFHHVVAILSSDSAAKVKDIIRNPPAGPYEALKAALTKKYEPSEHERAAAILAVTSLGDAKPSQVIERFQNLLGGREGGILLRYHFLSILPSHIRNALAFSTTTDLTELGAEADRIFIAGRDPEAPQIFAASEAEVDRVQQRRRPSKPTNGRNGQVGQQDGLCFFHARFGAKAKKCESPCMWSGNGPAGRQQ